MLTATDSVLAEAREAIYEISADEHMRQLLEAREDALRQEMGVQSYIAEMNAKLDAAYALLRKHGIDPSEASV